jgi:hypothetical protein
MRLLDKSSPRTYLTSKVEITRDWLELHTTAKRQSWESGSLRLRPIGPVAKCGPWQTDGRIDVGASSSQV